MILAGFDFHIEELVVPVVAGANDGAQFHPRALLGTAFFLTETTFCTAWHVIEAAEQHMKDGGTVALLGAREGANTVYHPQDLWRPHAQADIGFGRVVDGPKDLRMRLQTGRPRLGADVIALGYASHLFSVGQQSYAAPIRYLKGHILSDVWVNDGAHVRRPVDYCELSFPVPPGCSGAPLFSGAANTVVGVCVGSERGEVFDYEDRHEDGKVTTVYKVELVGIAEMTSVIASALPPWTNGAPLPTA